jgi:O-antigen ligase
LTGPEPPLWERAAVVFVIFMLSQALIGPLFSPDQAETPVLRLFWLPVYAVIFGLMVYRAPALVRAWPAWIIVGGLVILVFASKYWSIDPAVTLRRTIAMAIASAFAVYLGAAFRGPHLPRVLMHAGLVMAVGSLVMIFANPTLGIHQTDNAGLWRGLWYEKNQMGMIMVASAIAAAACLASPDPRRLLPGLTLALSVLLVLATQSKTSLLCLLVGLGAVATLWSMRRGGPAFAIVVVWIGVVVGGAAAELWFTDAAEVLRALGKDPSLTGRTEIWESVMRRVAERPMTGYGYAAFWTLDSVPADIVQAETGWPAPSAHNGWMDLLVQLGWPGTVFVAVVVALAGLAAAIRMGGQGVREGRFSIAYLPAFLVLSLSESVLMTHANLPWVLVLTILTRTLISEPAAARLAAPVRRPYQSAPRIAAHFPNGQARRSPVPVRPA